MTNNQIRACIRSGWPFLSATSTGAVLARYVPFGTVFRWEKYLMIPTPLQGNDLMWWQQASDEEDYRD